MVVKSPLRLPAVVAVRPDESVSSIARLLAVSRTTLYKYVPEITGKS